MMTDEQRAVVERLLAHGRKVLDAPRSPDFKTKNNEAEKLLSDLEGHPHFFVLACLMDRQIDAPLAWIIPYKIGTEVGGVEFADFERLTEERITSIFTKQKLHRFNHDQAKIFYAAVRDIREKYHGDASKIWAGTPKSAMVVRRFLEFVGAGVKIATMAANILVMDFKVPMADHSSIDISPDARVMRYFKKHGLLREEGDWLELVYLTRELNPEYPGLLDRLAWLEGGAAERRR